MNTAPKRKQKTVNKLKKLGLAAGGALAACSSAMAQTDISGVTTAVSGYKDAAIVVGIAILLFVIGRKVVRKLI